jgi:hypothetical protein
MNMKLKAYFYYDIISPYAYFFLKSRKALEDKLINKEGITNFRTFSNKYLNLLFMIIHFRIPISWKVWLINQNGKRTEMLLRYILIIYKNYIFYKSLFFNLFNGYRQFKFLLFKYMNEMKYISFLK